MSFDTLCFQFNLVLNTFYFVLWYISLVLRIFKNILLSSQIYGYTPDMFLLLSSNFFLWWVRKHMLCDMWVQSFYIYWDYFFGLAYGLSWWMFHLHLKILLLGRAEINVSLCTLVDSFVEVVYIFTDFMSICSSITERRMWKSWLWLLCISV